MIKHELANLFLHGGDYNPEQWLDYPEVLAKDIELMKEAQINTVTIGMFSWSMLEPEEGNFNFKWLDKIFDEMYSINVSVILGTPSAARPAWMAQKYPEVLRTNNYRQKMLYGGRHNHCFSSKIYRQKIGIMNSMLAERYGNHPALLMWHISNEYGGECHCEQCQEKFRIWLKKKYTNLTNLNNAWWGAFWSHIYTDWDQIESPSPLGESMVHGLNLDWKRFVTDQTIDFYKHEIESIRQITPQIPITTNFMADNLDLLPYQELNYEKFSKYVDVVSWDCYPAWHNDKESTADVASKVGFMDDLYRSLKQKPFLLMESTPSNVNWHPVNKSKRPGMHFLSSLQHIAHGSNSNLYFQWRKSRGASEKFHGAVVGNDNSDKSRVFCDVREVGHALEKISAVSLATKRSDVAIIFDWENNWALNDSQGFSNKTKCYSKTIQEHYRYFWNKDIQVDVITPSADFSIYKLIIAPMLYLLSSQTIDKLTNYVEFGGNLVSTYLTGLVDESDLTFQDGWPKELKALFGIDVLEYDTYYPSQNNTIEIGDNIFETKDYNTVMNILTAKTIGVYKNDFYKAKPAITENSFGKGQTYFIGSRTDYDFLNFFYEQICGKLGLFNQFIISGDDDVSVQTRQGRNQNFHFIMNFSEKDKNISVLTNSINLLTEKEVGTEIHLSPYEVMILQCQSLK